LQLHKQLNANKRFRNPLTPFNDKLTFLTTNSFIFGRVFRPASAKNAIGVVMGMLKRSQIAAKVIVCRSLKKLNSFV
jgi:hypothetical protein